MALKQVNYKIKGMSQDLGKSIHNPEFSFENKNIRFTSKESGTLLSIENEKGTEMYFMKDMEENNIQMTGVCLGSAVINSKVVLFVHDPDSVDYIYLVLNMDNTDKIATSKILFSGDLNFSPTNPIQTIVSYENENIQKVYWVDGLNSPRMINIAADLPENTPNDFFDFVSSLTF
jgi:hypothetical protein